MEFASGRTSCNTEISRYLERLLFNADMNYKDPMWECQSLVSNAKLDSEQSLLHYLAVLLPCGGNWPRMDCRYLKMKTDMYYDRWYRQSCYHEFTIPKKSGGERKISAPDPCLKDIQRVLASILVSRYFISSHAHGFAPGRSVISNARLHVGKNYVFNTDICNFFPSITGSMVQRALERYGIPVETAVFIRTVCCYMSFSDGDIPDEVLPQGAPSSPVLSNMVCAKMDMRLTGLARRFGLEYSRYADDITFSSNHNVYIEGSEFRKELQSILSDNGFTMNAEKTRIQKRGEHQEVTGLTVCEKVNVNRDFIKNLRAMIFRMEMYGYTKDEYKSARGKIAYLGMVRGLEDNSYRKLCARLKKIKGKNRGFLNQHTD